MFTKVYLVFSSLFVHRSFWHDGFPSRILLTPEARAFEVPVVNKLSRILLIWKYFAFAFIF